MAGDPWDSDPQRPKENPQGEIARRVTATAAAQRARVKSDRNEKVPPPEYDPVTKNQLYETAPIPLPRLFGSPFVMSGKYAIGPNGERQVLSGWGDGRSSGYDKSVNNSAKHQALDFTAPFGEQVLSSADGTVVFVGFQARGGRADVDLIYADDAKEEMYNHKGDVVASKVAGNIGFGGMCIHVRHNGDFQGYQTEYYHLNKTFVRSGQKIHEGDIIAEIGATGGYYNWFPYAPGTKIRRGTHLHYQVAYVSGGLRVLVRPTAIVPNRWPGHTDSTNSGVATDIILPLVATVGGQVAASRAAQMLSAFNRSTTLQNKGTQEIKEDQANHAGRTADTLDVQASALYATDAAFKGEAPKVVGPMTFDFDKGVWLLNGVENGVV